MTREIAMLVHPGSGRGRGARHAAVAEPRLVDAGFRVRRLEGRDGDQAQELARRAVHEGAETMVVVGGDGLVHLALQSLVDSSTTLGIIPAGTGNDAARYFDVPRNDPRAAAELRTFQPLPLTVTAVPQALEVLTGRPERRTA